MVDGSEEYKKKCNPDYFCNINNNVRWHIDWDNKDTLYNWMTHFELCCSPKIFISGPSMCFFFGFAVGVIILPALSDKNGRKAYFLLCFLL